MCRFLLAKSKQPISPKPFLKQFAQMSEKSKALDGDWQGDGWGISWLDKNDRWQVHKSLRPIWQDVQSFKRLDLTTIFVVHARSATFPQHKNALEYNQPFTDGKYLFVFNGHLKGVSLAIPGKIGAQKIWFLLRQALHHPQGDSKQHKHPAGVIEALEKVKNLLKKNAKQIPALNIGLSDGINIYAMSYYTKHPEYYRLRYIKTKELSLISSEPIGNYDFSETSCGSILSF